MKLFTPYTFLRSGKTSHNRIALAPMTNLQSNDDGTLGEDEYNWLVSRAMHGFGIIITCAAHVSQDGQGWKGELGIFSDHQIPGLKTLADGIHEHGCLAFVQLFHGGARSPKELTGVQPWSASPHTVKMSGGEVPVREATEEDIERTIQSFSDAAIRAFESGFDGVELHGAHGYLIHQFLSTFTNKRTDKWGGSAENRYRFVLRIMDSIKERVPLEFIVGVRLSPEDKYGFKGIDFDESLALAEELASHGADFIHVSPWDAFKKPEKYPDSDKIIVSHFRERLPQDVAVLVAGNIWSATDADSVLEAGSDFVALGKSAIGIPNWPSKAKEVDFIPQRPPYSAEHLKNAGLGDAFINYMKRWENFVSDE